MSKLKGEFDVLFTVVFVCIIIMGVALLVSQVESEVTEFETANQQELAAVTGQKGAYDGTKSRCP